MNQGMFPNDKANACYEFLCERRRKLNDEFEWNDENKKKLVKFDMHIRKLEDEMYQTFLLVKENLTSLIAQGFDCYKDYQVDAKIAPDKCWNIKGENDWVSNHLMDYAKWDSIESFSFGYGIIPEDPFRFNGALVEAWDKWLNIEEFSDQGLTRYMYNLLEDEQRSLYSYKDIVNMNFRNFRVSYKIVLCHSHHLGDV